MSAPLRTSDELWPRRALVAALAASAVVAAVLAALPAATLEAPGALSEPHVRAGVSCAACHAPSAADPVAPAACVRCHGAHPSTRPAHAALAARGALGCPSCHAAHDAPDPLAVEAGVVARVPLSACARCHQPSNAADPVQACAGRGSWSGLSACLDEHQTPARPLRGMGVCFRQHGTTRYVAWEQARASPVNADTARSAGAAVAWLGGGLGALGLVVTAQRVRRKRDSRRRAAGSALDAPPRAAARVLLPRIDAATCLGCQACVDVCPFDVLSVERHLAVVARPDACCSVGSCQQACPNGSLTLVSHDAPDPDTLRLSATLESLDAPGLFVAGDLSGLPLIRNAIVQGARVVSHIAQGLPARERRPDPTPGAAVDLVIVGAGPAGLAAALRARELGLSCVVLEQFTLAASIAAFPRGKIVHDPPLHLPLEGPLWLRESTKEELVAQWTRIARTHRLGVKEGHRVTGVRREGPVFSVAAATATGPVTLPAARILLATGRRGSPRRLPATIDPAARGRVVYSLSDAAALAGKRVLVVGLGDSALEAIMALARQPGTGIVVSCRGQGFRRGSSRNVQAVQRLVAAGRVRLVPSSTVTWVRVGAVTLDSPLGPEILEVDAVLALLGGQPSWALLEAAGLRRVV